MIYYKSFKLGQIVSDFKATNYFALTVRQIFVRLWLYEARQSSLTGRENGHVRGRKPRPDSRPSDQGTAISTQHQWRGGRGPHCKYSITRSPLLEVWSSLYTSVCGRFYNSEPGDLVDPGHAGHVNELAPPTTRCLSLRLHIGFKAPHVS
jgi:hypothetical protein